MINEFERQAMRRQAILESWKALADEPNRPAARDEALKLAAELLLITCGQDVQQLFLAAMK